MKRIKEINAAKWDDLNGLERQIRNTAFIIKEHQEALKILERNKSGYMPQLTIKKAIEKDQKWLKMMLQMDKEGKTDLL